MAHLARSGPASFVRSGTRVKLSLYENTTVDGCAAIYKSRTAVPAIAGLTRRTLHKACDTPLRYHFNRESTLRKNNYSNYPRYLSTTAKMASATSVFDFKPLDKKGQPKPLTEYQGKVLLIVNTASKCGFTPQYGTLETLYKNLTAKYPGQFEILGFPCNQFGGQEPGTDDQIAEFCQLNYGVSFPIFGKTMVNGDDAEPLWDWMKKEKPGLMGLKRVKWNFEKFLIGKDGKVIDRWASTKNPLDLESVIEAEIKKGAAAKTTL